MRYLIVLMLAGCGTIQVPDSDGKRFTIEHNRANFSGALSGAKDHCAKLGMKAEHIGTDRSEPSYNLSRFECVAK
jgi:hypothetical protein